MSEHWSKEDEQRLRIMCGDNFALADLCRLLKRSENAVRKRCVRLGIQWGEYSEARARGGHAARKLRAMNAYRPRDHRASNIWHLIDLKRAGHSPTRTELRIGGDGLARVFYPQTVAVFSSPAQLCAE